MALKQQLTILVIDDNRIMRQVITKMLEVNNHKVLEADGHDNALKKLAQNSIDLVLMDIEMPDINGYELTRIIREKYPKWFPIIFLSGNNSEDALVKGIDAGGDDYLTKPVKQVILNAKIRALARIVEMQAKLDLLNNQLEKLSNQDPLTKLLNRRALAKKLREHWFIQQREGSPLSVIMLDIDHFKSFNDNYGHPAGDACLKKIALLLKQELSRETDIIARYGGEEFIILLPFTCEKNAAAKAQSIIERLKAEPIPHEFSSAANHVTVSIGISSTDCSKPKSYKELISFADISLYYSKHHGRNRLTCYNPALNTQD